MALSTLRSFSLLIPELFLCFLLLLDAFFCSGSFLLFAMCISNVSCGPIMLTKVRIDSRWLVAQYSRIHDINASGVVAFLTHYTLMAQLIIELYSSGCRSFFKSETCYTGSLAKSVSHILTRRMK